jgi:hypothetical protein
MPEQPPKSLGKERRAQRLAAALRENLRKRKAQARGRERASDEQVGEPESRQDR